MDLSRQFVDAEFPPRSQADVDALEDRLLAAIAAELQEPPDRGVLAARSSELMPLVDDLLADCAAFALACERQEPEETTAQLRAVARYASETLMELLDGMTWTVGTTVVKLTEEQGEWRYGIGSGRSAAYPTKAAARRAAGAALGE